MGNGYAGIIARRLRKMIDESDTCAFPPFAQVAGQLHISPVTVAKAARILINEGILSGGGQGRRCTVIQAKNISSKKPVLRADEQAAIKIREYIGSAEAREQIRLPVMYLVKKTGYSHRSVYDALRLLVKEGVVEKYGKYYAVAQEKEEK